MSIKLKILGMALLALVATSAFAVMNASAESKGHFLHHGPTNNAWITAHEAAGTAHQLKFYRLGADHKTTINPPIECEKATYTGTVKSKTIPSETEKAITLSPDYTNCTTEGGTPNEVKVDVNGCDYTFFPHGANTHGTVEIDCPVGNKIVITHPNCTINIPAQTTASTLTEGIRYDAVEEEVGGSKVHALTGTVTVNTITGHFEGGLCIFLGTSHKFEMVGTVTVKGYEDKPDGTEGPQISITHK